MARILSIETSSYVCSVALAKEGKTIAIKESKEDKSHATLLTKFIEEILQENSFSVNDLDAVAVSKGPGSYTGLRIGVSTAKGICFGADIPLISVCSLQSMANGVLNENSSLNNSILLCPMIDARRMEVYTAIYDTDLNEKMKITASIIDENSFKEELKENEVLFFGNGAQKCKSHIDSINAFFIDHFDPSARYMIQLAEEAFSNSNFENTAYFEPFYLKDFIPTTPKKNLIGKI